MSGNGRSTPAPPSFPYTEANSLDEDQLMREAAAGDPEAFGQIVRAHQRRVVRVAARLLGDPEAAEDAAQETFLRVWRARHRSRAEGSFGRFLLRILRNVCVDQARAARARLDRCFPLDASVESSLPGADAPERQVEGRALEAAVREAVLSLPEGQRDVFILSHYEGL